MAKFVKFKIIYHSKSKFLCLLKIYLLGDLFIIYNILNVSVQKVTWQNKQMIHPIQGAKGKGKPLFLVNSQSYNRLVISCAL